MHILCLRSCIGARFNCGLDLYLLIITFLRFLHEMNEFVEFSKTLNLSTMALHAKCVTEDREKPIPVLNGVNQWAENMT